MERNKGFSLIEVLVAIFILALGIVSFLNLFPLGLQSLSYARKLNEVYFVAEKKLEELKMQPAIEPGQISGAEQDLNWTISSKPLQLQEGINITAVELDIDFGFFGRAQKQKFVTYVVPK